jgi:hypothetical protein
MDLPARRLLDVVRGFRQGRRPSRADEDVGTLFREETRRLQPDSLAAARDDSRFASQS